MVLSVQRLEPRPCHVRIDLGGRDIAVSQKQLNDSQIRAVIEEMGGEGMAQGVWRQGLCDPGTHGVALDEIPECLAGQGSPAPRDEQKVGRRARQEHGSGLPEIAIEQIQRASA